MKKAPRPCGRDALGTGMDYLSFQSATYAVTSALVPTSSNSGVSQVISRTSME
jgi:hypothetical protein